MWLINVKSLALEFFTSSKKVPYAILSHTWEDGEVSFQELQNLDVASKKKGFKKIRATCSIAKERGLGYAWVDTCCINKESSAELSEAINSMFRWYQNSAVCLVFLSDLAPGTDKELVEQWGSCLWFTRGWTLQELIAPASVDFFDREWQLRGTKTALLDPLFTTTTIDRDVLSGETRLGELLAAKKMSWAASRRATRDEDIAYCLMGIFDINMPLLYGEGYKAFLRLQEEILKQNRDLSVLAWNSQYPETYPYEEAEDTKESAGQTFRGIFACSPSEFKDCRSMIPQLQGLSILDRADFMVTSKVMRSNYPLVHSATLYTNDDPSVRSFRDIGRGHRLKYVAFLLYCTDENLRVLALSLVVILRKTSLGYLRIHSKHRLYASWPFPRVMPNNTYFLARTHVPAFLSRKSVAEYSGALWVPPGGVHHRLELLDIFAPPGILDTENRMLVLSRTRGNEAPISFRFRLRPPAAADDEPVTKNSDSVEDDQVHYQSEFILRLERPSTEAELLEQPNGAFWVLKHSLPVPGSEGIYKRSLSHLREFPSVPPGQFYQKLGSLAVGRACIARPRDHLSHQGTLMVEVITELLQDIGLSARDSESGFLYSLRFGWEDDIAETSADPDQCTI